MNAPSDLCWRPDCPNCKSKRNFKNGSIHNKKQKYKCFECGRQFVENPTKKQIPEETKNNIDLLLLERIPLVGIARITGVSRPWLWLQAALRCAIENMSIRNMPKPPVK